MLTIGKVSKRVNVSRDTLRFYERERLLTPSGKSDGGYRLYDGESVRRVEFIKRAQLCGFTLSEIRELLSLRGDAGACCGDIRSRTIEKKLQIMAKIKVLQSMSRTLDELIQACDADDLSLEACPILHSLDQPGAARTRGAQR
ncbi:MAG: Zn(2+)-responsive transcriptional regulator [Sphingomicrobium sp.]